MEPIQIVTATNDNYARPLAVMLNSLLENKVSKNHVHIYIIDGDNISTRNKLKLVRSVKRFNVKPHFLPVNRSLYKNFKIGPRFSKESLYRISIPDLLDKKIKKALYLDCDLIVKKDITHLWETNIDDYFVAAAERNNKRRCRQLSIPKQYGYFNSGVLLMNLKKWRKNGTSKKVLQFIKDNPSKIRYVDQDGLNAVLYDKCFKLHRKWNTSARKKPKFNPAIIHYTTRNKPWNGNPPRKKEYMKYLRKTVW